MRHPPFFAFALSTPISVKPMIDIIAIVQVIII